MQAQVETIVNIKYRLYIESLYRGLRATIEAIKAADENNADENNMVVEMDNILEKLIDLISYLAKSNKLNELRTSSVLAEIIFKLVNAENTDDLLKYFNNSDDAQECLAALAKICVDATYREAMLKIQEVFLSDLMFNLSRLEVGINSQIKTLLFGLKTHRNDGNYVSNTLEKLANRRDDLYKIAKLKIVAEACCKKYKLQP